MITQRKLIAFLALSALLMSNVVAFVHVGQHQSAISAAGNTSSIEESTESGCSCCSHSTTCEPAEDGGSHPDEQEHDSGSCNICQSFYTARAGVHYPAPAFVDCGSTVDFLPICTSPAAISVVPAGFDARGPPSLG